MVIVYLSAGHSVAIAVVVAALILIGQGAVVGLGYGEFTSSMLKPGRVQCDGTWDRICDQVTVLVVIHAAACARKSC